VRYGVMLDAIGVVVIFVGLRVMCPLVGLAS
jgi:hypothetical protein